MGIWVGHEIKLDNGRYIVHVLTPNGAQDVMMADGGDMSDAEWDEYCEKFKAHARMVREIKAATR